MGEGSGSLKSINKIGKKTQSALFQKPQRDTVWDP